MLLRTIVEHEVLDLLAEAALVKVQVDPRSSSLAAAVGTGAAAGAAATSEAPALSRAAVKSER